MTNYKYSKGYIPENEKELIEKYQDQIEDAIASYDFENSYETSIPIKQIIRCETNLANKQILYFEISVQLAHKLLCDWEQISHFYASLFVCKIKKRKNPTDDPKVSLRFKKDKIPLSLFLQRVAETILSTSIYNITAQREISERLLSEFDNHELTQALSNTIRLIKEKLVDHKPSLNKPPKNNKPSDFIENIESSTKKIFIILIENKVQVRYATNNDAFFPIIFEMVVFYFRHRELLEHPSVQALRLFNNSLLTQINSNTSNFDSTILSKANLLTDHAINLSIFFRVVDLNNIDRYTISHFSKTQQLDEKVLDELWSLIRNQKNGVRQNALQNLPDPIFNIETKGFPHIGFYQAFRTSV